MPDHDDNDDDSKEWETHYQRLLLYHRQHSGSTEDPSLAEWIAQQRALVKSGELSTDRRRKLFDLGVPLGLSNAERWQVRYEDLIAYKEKHGDCEVPSGYEDHPALSSWVKNQRTKHALGNLSAERVAKLSAIGFNWRLKGKPRPKPAPPVMMMDPMMMNMMMMPAAMMMQQQQQAAAAQAAPPATAAVPPVPSAADKAKDEDEKIVDDSPVPKPKARASKRQKTTPVALPHEMPKVLPPEPSPPATPAPPPPPPAPMMMMNPMMPMMMMNPMAAAMTSTMTDQEQPIEGSLKDSDILLPIDSASDRPSNQAFLELVMANYVVYHALAADDQVMFLMNLAHYVTSKLGQRLVKKASNNLPLRHKLLILPVTLLKQEFLHEDRKTACGFYRRVRPTPSTLLHVRLADWQPVEKAAAREILRAEGLRNLLLLPEIKSKE